MKPDDGSIALTCSPQGKHRRATHSRVTWNHAARTHVHFCTALSGCFQMGHPAGFLRTGVVLEPLCSITEVICTITGGRTLSKYHLCGSLKKQVLELWDQSLFFEPQSRAQDTRWPRRLGYLSAACTHHILTSVCGNGNAVFQQSHQWALAVQALLKTPPGDWSTQNGCAWKS